MVGLESHEGKDGHEYCTLAAAALRLDVSETTARRELELVDASVLVEVPRGRGRPPAAVVRVEEVERRRAEKLERLGVSAPGEEIKGLRRTIRMLESMYAELHEDFEVLAASEEAQRRELVRLRERVRAERAGAVHRSIGGMR